METGGRESTPAETRVRLGVTLGNKEMEVVGLVDTGNLLRNGLAVSLAFVRKHRLRFVPARFEIGTAKRGAPLEVVGKLVGLTITVGRARIKNCVALIISKLSTPVNVGTNLLKAAGATLTYGGQNKLTIQGETVPLIQTMGSREKSCNDVSRRSGESSVKYFDDYLGTKKRVLNNKDCKSPCAVVDRVGSQGWVQQLGGQIHLRVNQSVSVLSNSVGIIECLIEPNTKMIEIDNFESI